MGSKKLTRKKGEKSKERREILRYQNSGHVVVTKRRRFHQFPGFLVFLNISRDAIGNRTLQNSGSDVRLSTWLSKRQLRSELVTRVFSDHYAKCFI